MKDHRKAAKLAVGVLAGGLVVSVIATLASGDSLAPTRAHFVCVASGEHIELTIDEAGMIPARHRRTGRRTLVPCIRGADGIWRVHDRYRVLLRERLREVNRYVDVETGQIHSAK